MFRSPNSDSYFFDIVTRILQGDTLAPFLFIICLDYVLRTSIDLIKKNEFTFKKARRKRYSAGSMTNAGYAYDLALLGNSPSQAKSRLHVWSKQQEALGST